MVHPYDNLPDRNFWKSFERDFRSAQMLDIKPPFSELSAKSRIGTAGSCFAQHIARNLKKYGMNFIDVEPAPSLLGAEQTGRFGYDMYSARYGNIYTSRQLLQLMEEAHGRGVRSPDAIWKRDGRFYDALRTGVEPLGLASEDDVRLSRAEHLKAIKKMFRSIDVFVFTLGLTETWECVETGTVFPVAPGVQGIGSYAPDRVRFLNLSVTDVVQDMSRVMAWLKRINPNLRVLLTVSPVPLAATASDEHALSATFYSKSVLRAAVEQLRAKFDCVEYFPSYEMVTFMSTVRPAFDDNLRNVRPEVVEYVMKNFFNSYFGIPPEQLQELAPEQSASENEADLICEEEALSSYAK